MRVLIAEDEPRVADALARGLRREGLAVDIAPDGSEALIKSRIYPYNVVVLDRDLPKVHGDDVCKVLNREYPDTKVLMVTAARSVDDRVEGLGLGADDYLTKPFVFAELVARVRALGRRSGAARPPVLSYGDLELDVATRTSTRAGEPLNLTPKELGVLEALMRAEGAVLSAEQLLEQVWDDQVDPFTNTVRMTIVTLRRKLGEPAAIHTVVGSGYRL
jgi:two-component system, OmpR family, response regulator VanR